LAHLDSFHPSALRLSIGTFYLARLGTFHLAATVTREPLAHSPWAVRSWMTLSEGPGKVLPQVGFPSSLCGKQLNRRNFLGQLAIVPHKRRSVEGSCYRALRAPAASVLRRGQGLPPLSPHRFLRSRNGVTVEVDFTRTVTGLLRYPPFRGINHDCGPGNADTGKGE
jgi:hypothetical protein